MATFPQQYFPAEYFPENYFNKGAEGDVVLPEGFRLYLLLPEIMRQLDVESSPRPLEAYVDGFEDTVSDETRRDVLRMLRCVDIDKIRFIHLPYLADHIGVNLENCDPEALQRFQVESALTWYKLKGTPLGYTVFFRTLGFDAEVVELFEDSPDGATSLVRTPTFPFKSTRIRLILAEDNLDRIRSLCGNEFGTLTPKFIRRILGRVEEITPIHVEIEEVRFIRSFEDQVTIRDDDLAIAFSFQDAVDFICCAFYGRGATESGLRPQWDNGLGIDWDATIQIGTSPTWPRFFWDLTLPVLDGPDSALFDYDNATELIFATDLATVATSDIVTSAGSTLITTGVVAGDFIFIEFGADFGIFEILDVPTETTLQLDTSLSATASSISFRVLSNITLRYDCCDVVSDPLVLLKCDSATVKESGTDLVTTSGSKTVTSAGSTFVTNSVNDSDNDCLVIASGPDAGKHVVDSVTNETTLELLEALTSTGSGLTFEVQDGEFVDLTPEN